MKTNVNAKRVLIYGDSLVYGKVSGANSRLDVSARFTGVLQENLGSEFEVIEEGLRGRILVGENGFFKERDGLKQFYGIVGSHFPLDLVIIILGTNDCNAKGIVNDQKIREAFCSYSEMIDEWVKFMEIPKPKILIACPPTIDESHYDEANLNIFGIGAAERVSQLPEIYQEVSSQLSFHYLNLQDICAPASGDGIHLDEQANKKVAEALEKEILEILK